MNKKTLKALEESIQKWEDIAAGTGEDFGAGNCALCGRFYDIYDCRTGNERCPVYRKTGQLFCKGSPYDEWLVWHKARNGRKADTQKGKCLARAERDFLIGLLP